MRHFICSGFIVALIAAAGCQAKLTVTQSFKLPDEDSNIVKTFSMPAQPIAQTITVNVTVKSGSNVDVFVVPASLVGDTVGKEPNEKKKWEDKAYGSKRDLKFGSMTAKVPANSEFKVMFIQSDDAREKSEVEVKITN